MVEDDPDIAALVVHKLTTSGHAVTMVADGDAALAAIRSARPDLVILDWMIPGPDGIEVCEAVRADADSDVARTRILMLTAKAQERDFERAFASGADEYMQKPFSTRELVLRAASILART